MATDSTNLPQGEMTLDAGIDMTGSDLDLTSVQVAQTEPANYVDLPKGNTVVLLPVQPGQTVRLPTDTTDGVLAKIGPEGNLAIVIDGRTIILQGYLKANDQSPIKIVTNDGDTVDVADLIANTDSSLDIQTAAGPASGNQGDGSDGSGIYIPFLAGPGLGGILAEGILDPTALQYRLIDNEFRIFADDEEDGGPTDIEITFDILGGVVNEDDLPGDDDFSPDNFQALLVVKDVGNDGKGNDPFDDDTSIVDGPQNDKAGDDATDGVPDSDPEPLTTQATVKVTFPPADIPGTLALSADELSSKLTSEGQPIIYQEVTDIDGKVRTIFGFVDGPGGDGVYDPDIDSDDRLVFDIKVLETSSNSIFHVDFTLHDNIDNTPPDANEDGSPDLLGSDEQVLGLSVKLIAADKDGDPISTIMKLGVQDDIPFFGEAIEIGEGLISIIPEDSTVTHDETKGVDNPDDQDLGDVGTLPQDLVDFVTSNGFSLPTEGESEGTLPEYGVAQSQVIVSFGADGGAVFDASNPDARDSIHGAISGSGENEHPFELFMIDPTKGSTPAEDNKSTGAVEGNLTATDQKTNATVSWNGGEPGLPVYLHQIDAHTIVGYVIPEGQQQPSLDSLEVLAEGQEAVFILSIDDAGVLTFVQLHQINHLDFPDNHDETFTIKSEDGSTSLVHVRITDFDGDHATQPVNIVIEDDGPVFTEVSFNHGNGTVDEDYLGKVLSGPGNFDLDNLLGGGNGDDQILDGTSASGKISFDFGADEPGKLSFGELVITDSKGKEWDISELKTADGNGITIQETTDGFGNIILTAIEAGSGDKVFTMTLDAEGGETGEFQFQLHQALQHPYTDSDSNNDGPETAFEDNFNFAFNVIATDIDKDTAQGTINISVDDDSPTANDDHDEVTEGKDKGGNLNFASGNVVTGGDATFLGKDGNVTFPLFLQFGDGTPDLPGADRPYTISKLEHDGNTYELSADGLTVTGLTDGDSYDALSGVLKITTEEGGTFEIVMTSSTPSLVGEYKYTVPVDADHDHDKHAGPADEAASKTGDFDTVLDWQNSFSAAGITLVANGGVLGLRDLNVSGPEYRGIGVNSGSGDNSEVDFNGPNETLELQIANPTDNIALTIGALYSGGPDDGYQEILLWQVFDGDTLVASGQILGSQTGLVPLDIDTNGVEFNRVVLTPIDNGAGANDADNSDFVLVNAEICCPEDKFVEKFDYTLRDSDGDEDTASLCIDVKDTKPKFGNERDATVTFLVDEDGIANGLKNASSKDDAETPGGTNVDNDGIYKGKINFVPGADTVTVELSVGDPSQPGNGDTGLDTVDGKNVFAAWDPATSTLVGYIQGTDPSETANRVFTAKVDNHQTGEFTFTLLKPVEHPDTDQSGDNNENNPNLSFNINFQIEDKDCDTIYGKLVVNIDDDMPVITQQSGSFSLIVDESLDGNTTPNNAGDHPHDPGDRIEDDEDGAGLPAALTNIANLPGVGDVIGAAKTSGSSLFTFQPGADGLQSAVYSLTLLGGGVGPVPTNLIDTLSGLQISLQGGNADGTIRGVTSAGDIVFAFSINGGTGEVSMAQYRAINHGAEEAAPGSHDEEKSLGAPGQTAPALTNLLSVTLTVADKDNDTVSSTVDITGKVKFEDDGPTACIDKKHDNEVTHDESAGQQNDDQSSPLPGVFPPGALGWARSDDAIVTTSGAEYGTDGAGTTVLSLKIPGDGTNSGLEDTATGKDILLYQSGDIVLGKVDGSGELVFAVSINQNGTIDVAQYRAIEHPDDDDHDEDVGISHDALQAWVTITDKDGDSDTASVDIGSRVRFDDDGPKAEIKLVHNAAIILDELKDPAAADGFEDKNANDEKDNVTGDIAYGTIDGKALFEDKSSYGTDDAGTKAYSLVVNNGTSSGLFDSETNANIRLYQVNATTIEGRPAVLGTDPVSFKITIDPVTGSVTVSQFRAVEHDNAGSSASDHDESGSPEIMDKEKLYVRQTIIDGDKDHDTFDLDISKIIKFEDDGPIARNDVDSLDPIANSKFESQGNVITGAAVTTPGIDDGGTDTPWVISNLVGSKTSDGNPSGGFNVTGTYGSLSMNTSGQYTYNFDEANWAGKVPSGKTDVFTYTLRDSDGDTDTATLTINLGEATVETSAVVNNGAGGCIPEDTFGPLTLKADPGTGDRVTQIVLSNVPAGWDIKDDSNADFVVVGGTLVGSPVFAGGQITFNISGAAPGVDVTVTVQVKGAPDSDLNGTGLVVSATVVDGVVFANDTTPFDVSIDAVADGDDKGDDGDADKLGVKIDVADGIADANTTFQVGETGNVNVKASYDDFKDGSETHTLTVQVPTGFTFDTGNVGPLPAGVVLDLPASDSDTLVFKVDSKDDAPNNGVGSLELNIPVVYGGGVEGKVSGDFTATVTATETPTELECNYDNNTDSATATDKADLATPPKVDAFIGVEGNTDVICVPEDSAGVEIPIVASSTPGSHLTELVVTGISDLAYTLINANNLADEPGVATFEFTFDAGTTGFKITFDGTVNSFNSTFVLRPRPDSDLDFGTLTVSVTAADDVDPTLTANDSDQAFVRVDAIADGKDDANGGDEDIDVLSVSLTAADSADGDATFAPSEEGTLTLGATFDDFNDGSEKHQVTVAAPAGFEFIPGSVTGLPAGVTVNGASTATNLILDVDSAGVDGVGGFANVQIGIKNVGAADATSLDFTATAKADEQNSVGTNGDGNDECKDDNNSQSVSTKAQVVTANPDQAPVAYDDKVCGDEAAPRNVNVLLILDRSGSMGDVISTPDGDKTRLQLMQEATISMLTGLAGNGDVKVMLVSFNADATEGSAGQWVDVATAIAAINALTPTGLTNYEDALEEGAQAFNSDVADRGDFASYDNLVFFMSDGVPTVGGENDDETGDFSLTDANLKEWDSFLEDAANSIDQLTVVGIGGSIAADDDDLEDVADPDYPGDIDSKDPFGEVLIVADENDLKDKLEGTVATAKIEGNVLDGSIENDTTEPTATPGKNNDPDFLGDTPTHISQFTYDAKIDDGLDITINYDNDGTIVPGDIIGGENVNISGTKVSFDADYGRMTFDFSNGKFTFLAESVEGGDKEEHFTYKLTDKDGDSDSANLTVCIQDKYVDLKPEAFDNHNALTESTTLGAKITVDNFNSGPTGTSKGAVFEDDNTLELNTRGDDGAVAFSTVRTSLIASGLNAAVLDNLVGPNPVQGSSYAKQFNVGSPSILTFTYEYAGNDDDIDIATYFVIKTDGTLVSQGVLGVGDPDTDGTISVPLAAAGDYRVMVLITDRGDDSNTSVLHIDSIETQPATINTVSGNVVTDANDSPPAVSTDPDGAIDDQGDGPATVTSVNFGATTVSVPSDGSNVTISGANGVLTISNTGAYTYTSLPGTVPNGVVETDAFTYVLKDADGDVDTAVLRLDVTGTNDPTPPNSNAGSGSGLEDAADIAVSISGTDADGTVASFKITSLPSGGTLYTDAGHGTAIVVGSIVPAGGNAATLHFVPNANFNGSPTFQYAAIDNHGQEDTTPATATITVTAVNDAPAIGGMGGTAAYTEGAAAILIDNNVTVADIDSANFNGGSLTVAFTANGTTADQLAISSQGTGDGQIGVSGANVSYNPVGVGGSANIGTFSGGTNGTPLVITFNANATPEAVDALIQRIAFANNSDSPSTSDRTVTFTLVDGDGTANGGSDTGTAIATVTVSAVNDAPTTSNVNASGNEDTTIVINLAGGDVDGSVAQFKITSLPANGKLYADVGLSTEIALNGTVAVAINAAQVFFVPTANYNGPASFQYTAIDNGGLADASPATASITVNSVDDATAAVANHIYVGTDSAVTIQAAWLLRDDSDADNALSVTSVDESTSKFGFNEAGLPSTFTVDYANSEPSGSADAFTYTLSTGTVVVGGQVHLDDNDATISGDATNDIIVGTGSVNTLNGNGGNDVVIGGAGADTLNGGDGDDFLDGGEDGDTYTGGKGNDTIDVGDGSDTVNYTSKLDGTDIIDNFDDDSGQDILNLDLLFDSLLTATLSRAALVEIDDNGTTVDIRVNADGIAGFELHVATINTADNVTLNNDVLVGTL